jgi:hypothetical protein
MPHTPRSFVGKLTLIDHSPSTDPPIRLSNWYVLWLVIQFCKYLCEGQRADQPPSTLASSRVLFFAFITHTVWEVPNLPISSPMPALKRVMSDPDRQYILVSLLRVGGLSEVLPWLGQIVRGPVRCRQRHA